MAFDIPNTPSNGDTMTVDGRVWAYNTSKTRWEIQPVASSSGGGFSDIFLLMGA